MICEPEAHLSTHMLEGKIKILGTNKKSEEVTHF